MSDLGFTGAAGVGRPFTIQDLFAAVASPTSASSSSTAVTVVNQYLDEESDTVSIDDVFTLAASSPVVYDVGAWEAGTWT